jgi:hypothetical protein
MLSKENEQGYQKRHTSTKRQRLKAEKVGRDVLQRVRREAENSTAVVGGDRARPAEAADGRPRIGMCKH